ncbi:phosphoglycerate kinase [Pararhodobacter zhoushanensis]|uniref:phosphoglycerate kinase n=1 Tax=Pararhodobacter zhoushanensis TaxID=2479545 RepID=UPI000F8EA1D8|nr:phosphoglycerate kinase [Pararhodobacter zhoushanensis]
MGWKTLDSLNFAGKTALVRVDINVPFENGEVSDFTRIDAVLPTIRDLSEAGAKVVLMAHFGRPKGQVVPEMSLEAVRPALSARLGKPVSFASDCIGKPAKDAILAMQPGDVLLLENTRFYAGEEKNDPMMAASLAALGDVYVNDAFSAAHRAHASTEGIAKLLPAFAGRLMAAELKALDAALGNPQRPVVAVVGGAKVSTKLELLGNLVSKVEYLVIGGGMANTFLAAQGHPVGKSLCEHDLADTAREILEKADVVGCRIVLPVDLVVAREFRANAPHEVVTVCPDDAMILDAGPASVAALADIFEDAHTLIWNGPLGAFEMEPFDAATNAAARTAAELTKAGKLVSVAGGGDTVAALNRAGAADDFTYISTAGGAFLEWMEGKELPGVKALED